ncbi:MAG: DUF3237 domain-containing protein [Acetobacteraceae bacterium]|nr:DUF3237 domain-containing protein [Acetobacteraceae bacterium]
MSLATRPLCTMRLRVGPPQEVGRGPDGHELRVVPVTGGTIEGERFSGEVLPGTAADWLRVEADGTAHIDVRLTARAASGSLVHVRYAGIRTGPAPVLARLARGEAVDPSEYYFRVTMRFETGAADLAWMNRVIAVGSGRRPPEGPVYEVFEIL